MRITPALWLSALLALSIGCGKDRQLTKAELPTINSETVAVETPKPPAKVTREAAIATAKTHYIKTLGSLKGIDFDASEEANGWHVNYYPHVRNGTIAGGGG
jgi:hypothetical protein